MRNCQRNQVRFWYRLYNKRVDPSPVIDPETLYQTGDYALTYGEPIPCAANISPARGMAQVEYFGDIKDYDKVIVTADMNCPIDEHSILYVDCVPVKDLNTGEWSKHDYVVTRVAKSINQIAIAIRKVDVS